MKFKKVMVRLVTTVVAAAMFSSMVFAAESTTLSNAPIQKVQQSAENDLQYVGRGNGISDITGTTDNPLARLTPEQYKKVDRMAMRQITVCPVWVTPEGDVQYGGPQKKDSSWNTFQQTIGLFVTASEKAQMLAFAEKYGTPIGFYTEVQFEISGASTTSYRSVVTRTPENIQTSNGIGNGVWGIQFLTPLDNPKMRWEGYFQYWYQFDNNQGLRTTLFDSFVNFAN